MLNKSSGYATNPIEKHRNALRRMTTGAIILDMLDTSRNYEGAHFQQVFLENAKDELDQRFKRIDNEFIEFENVLQEGHAEEQKK